MRECRLKTTPHLRAPLLRKEGSFCSGKPDRRQRLIPTGHFPRQPRLNSATTRHFPRPFDRFPLLSGRFGTLFRACSQIHPLTHSPAIIYNCATSSSQISLPRHPFPPPNRQLRGDLRYGHRSNRPANAKKPLAGSARRKHFLRKFKPLHSGFNLLNPDLNSSHREFTSFHAGYKPLNPKCNRLHSACASLNSEQNGLDFGSRCLQPELNVPNSRCGC